MEAIYATVMYRGKNPRLREACMRANLAGCAYQDKDLEEQHRECKKIPSAVQRRTGKSQ